MCFHSPVPTCKFQRHNARSPSPGECVCTCTCVCVCVCAHVYVCTRMVILGKHSPEWCLSTVYVLHKAGHLTMALFVACLKEF